MARSGPRKRAADEVRGALSRAQIGRQEVADALGINRHILTRKLNGEYPIGIEELNTIAEMVRRPELVEEVVLAAKAAS